MASNITVKNAAGTDTVVKTTESGGVHVPHYNIDTLPADPFGANADAAVEGDNPGSINAHIRGHNKTYSARTPTLGQHATAGSVSVTLSSDHANVPVAPVATEAHLGEVGGRIAVVDCAPTINPAAYAAGDMIGSKVTIAGVTRVAAGSGLIRSATLSDKAKQSVAVDVILFDADPSASTFTDNAAAAVAAADLPKIVGVLSFATGDYVAFNANSVAHKAASTAFKLAAGSSLYAVFVSRGTPTYASASDLTLRLAIEQN